MFLALMKLYGKKKANEHSTSRFAFCILSSEEEFLYLDRGEIFINFLFNLFLDFISQKMDLNHFFELAGTN